MCLTCIILMDDAHLTGDESTYRLREGHMFVSVDCRVTEPIKSFGGSVNLFLF